MRIIRPITYLFCTGLLAACAAFSAQPPLAPGQMVQLQPGQGIAALLMDTLDPVTQVRLSSSDGKGPELDLPSMPAGRTLALFAVPAGVYCLDEFSYGRYRFFAKRAGIGCFRVPAGRVAYSGNLRPTAGRDPDTGRDAALVAQMFEPHEFLEMLKRQYPALAAAYPTAGPAPAAEGGAQNDLTQAMATWSVEAPDHLSFDIYLRNNTNWDLTLTDFEIAPCTNLKRCGKQPTGTRIAANTTLRFLSVQPADPKKPYVFNYSYNYRRADTGGER